MDPRERADDQEEMLRAALDGRQAQIWTCLPGIIVSFDAAAMTCVVQPAIQGQYRDQTGALSNVTLPLLLDCPVVFPSGGGYTLTFPITTGDECEIRFATRCIDAWWQLGGVRPQAELRMHDLSDGFVMVGPRSQPRVLSGVSATSAQLRSDDGASYVEMAAGHVVNVVAPGGINLNGVTIDSTGNMASPAKITAVSDVVAGFGGADQIGLQTHKHPTAATGAPSSPTPGT